MVTGVLLAAGGGSRLGLGPKALLPYRGSTLVEHLGTVLLDGGCAEVVVVLGSQADRVRTAVHLPGCRVVVNPQWETGMGSSLRRGISSVGTSSAETSSAVPGADVLVALVDQPAVTPELIRRLLENHAPGQITAAGFPGEDGTLKRAHPVVFDARLAQEAAAVAEGDAGARAFLRTHRDLVRVIDCGDLGDGRDVDLPADLALLGESGPHVQGA